MAAHTPRFFNQQQIQTLEAISEAITPADARSPGAKAARVWETMDEIIADSDGMARSIWTEGPAALDKIPEVDHGRKFIECSSEQQTALLEKIGKGEEHPTRLEEQFFVAVKQATIDGTYTSAIVIHKDLEYPGNIAKAEFEDCTHDEHKTWFVVRRQLRMSGQFPAVGFEPTIELGRSMLWDYCLELRFSEETWQLTTDEGRR